ncbi:hypothetical protein [Bacillus phage SPO1L4]|nr:hypothetical protein Goe9_c00350 [Bacillus phage vB_BsuM-Goe9]WIT26567.1 hypothetical protein [Bacillus phage SPO1L4]WIT26766.1 hypothetical protein [Bacillus phage SPO1L5]
MEIPIPKLKVVREFGEVKPVKDHSYVMVTDPWSTGRHTIHGPVPDLLMDDMWFEVMMIRKKMVESVVGNIMSVSDMSIIGGKLSL